MAAGAFHRLVGQSGEFAHLTCQIETVALVGRHRRQRPHRDDISPGMLWVRFADGIDVEQLVGKALELDLVVRSGRQFSPFGQAENALRLGFASLDMDEIRLAVQRLAQAAKAIATSVP